jgi:phage tail-like protein
MSTRPLSSDPLRNFKFHVSINHGSNPNLARLGFMSVSGLTVQSEVIPYREGGSNTTTRKMPGQTDFGPIGFSRGMMAVPIDAGTTGGTRDLWDWFLQLFSVLDGMGQGPAGTDFRATVDVDVLQHPITVGPGSPFSTTSAIKARFQIFNAWPMSLSYSDLDAGGNGVIIEQLTLAHEGFRILWAQPGTDPGSWLPETAGNGNNVGA